MITKAVQEIEREKIQRAFDTPVKNSILREKNNSKRELKKLKA